ncbi:hypothetical protein [Desulfovibrio sp. UCD-KL4C]|uniref:hypothetical protein n=1 Tax=Desulfovibrio sp. UCD-KL4C TaxID=2578120 RepID=UPI0025B998E0|nr:hypothetical protein [Desulfovibrio sp. UCD-KL4C]
MKKSELLEIIKEILNHKKDITIADSSQTLDAWDSLAQLQILMRIDQATGGKAANIPELAIALSVQEIITTLDANGLIDA